MTNEELLKVIEEAKASGITRLDLSFKQITTLPSELFSLTSLTELCLNNNQLIELPSEISRLKNLTLLDLSNNQLRQLPAKICKLTRLTMLELLNNQLPNLPIEIFQLSKLEKLTLTGNPLGHVSPAIRQLANLKELYIGKCQLTQVPLELFQLIQLTCLGLWENQIWEVPSEISRLSNLSYLSLSKNQLRKLPKELFQLTNLTHLDIDSNQLTSLPQELGQLTKLKALNLNHNQLTQFPAKICQLTQLELLDLGGTNLTRLPVKIGQLTKLTKLYLWDNKLTSLPSSICHLAELTELNIYGNRLACPPYEIADKGIGAIRQYFAELDKEAKPLNEVKLILIGEGAAGKTSLAKNLLGKSFDQDEGTTHGINIQGWDVETGGKKIRVNIWDFGGQEIQHATHQFFLSKRSLYVLVLDGRKDERAEYWLRHIESFGGDSPVLVVLNKYDANPSFDVNRIFLQGKYPSIRHFFRTSCKNGRGIHRFKEVLLEELAKVEMLETIWPASWFKVKRNLEELDSPYINAEEYRSICTNAGIAEENGREKLVDFLHDLGVAVHFKDFNLDAMHVLNPIWVTNAVYKIITAEKMADSKGFLDLTCLGEILPYDVDDPLTCSPETRPFIMRLMQKFELCYELSKESVLIPQLLPVPEPQINFDYSRSLRFIFYYPDFMPPSVFPRFMVNVYKDIEDGLRWRTGVVLTDEQRGVRAVIKADTEAKLINIWVEGQQRREYLHYLRYLLTYINSSFEKLTVSERVPMPDDPARTADYETLLRYAKEEMNFYIPEGSDKKYSVYELLGLVQPKDADELARVAEKVTPKDTITWTELLIELFGPNLPVPVLGITLNLKGFFEKLLARQKQKRQQVRG